MNLFNINDADYVSRKQLRKSDHRIISDKKHAKYERKLK